jgi:xanthine dehydrogenase YagT iron-sulfur-binding subunit
MSKGDLNLAEGDSRLAASTCDADQHPRRQSLPQAEVSRRGFLKQSGGAASAAALLSLPIAETVAAGGGTKVPATAGPAQVLGPGAVPATLLVNGKPQKVMIEPRDTLVTVLRDRLGLLGTKLGCDRGGCGACTVWVAGSANAGLYDAGAGRHRDCPGQPPLAVTTVEGLAKGSVLHPLQQAFVDKDALQCGFCTSGMLMSCAALHEQARAAGKLASAR